MAPGHERMKTLAFKQLAAADSSATVPLMIPIPKKPRRWLMRA